MPIKTKLAFKYLLIFLLAAAVSGCATTGSSIKLDPSLLKDVRTFDGASYVSLTRVCDVYGLRQSWDPYTSVATVEKSGKIVLRSGSDLILVNGVERKLDRPVVMSNGEAYVPASFVKNNVATIAPITVVSQSSSISGIYPATTPSGKYIIRTIVIDSGHGGKDGGAVGKTYSLKEKETALYVAKKLASMLRDRGIKVIMTRDSDVFIELQKRCDIANASGADLFISVHINASTTRSLLGFECYYLSEATDDNARVVEAFENSSLKIDQNAAIEHSKLLDKTLWDITLSENRRESIELAKRMCSAVDKSLLMRNRGIKSARFIVLKGSRIPAILAEVGYISNRYEEMKLKDKGYLDKMASALAQGVISYKDEYEKTEGFTI